MATEKSKAQFRRRLTQTQFENSCNLYAKTRDVFKESILT